MKQRKYPKKDEPKDNKEKWTGVEYTLEDKDEVVSNFEKVKETSFPAMKDGKPVIIKKNSLSVNHKELGDIFLKISDGQKKQLDKVADLKGKIIVGRKYTNKFGDQVGVTIK